ncbi:MAG: hypothetical protein A3F12_00115 [Gammaproteobacteria bacterium RIFCSPHIGHO2_12_FULL_38_14]|nr:MAG: hypothetical protein A3F12_00115 [Gammaproteobacteria bacterium RIFCSPHIGHO2_12_FULL_38_14]
MISAHIFPVILPFLLFLFWLALGYPLLIFLNTRRHLLKNMLLAPTFGMAITLLPVFWLNRLNIPIEEFGKTLTFFYLIIIFLGWYFLRPTIPIKQYTPFFGVLILGLCLVGWPLILFGFHWISYGNDDMNNYCLGALRYLHHGYFDIPAVSDFTEGKDYSAYYWILHAGRLERAGAELQLAWFSSVIGLAPLSLFMPLVIALHLCLISASGALVLLNRRWKHVSLAVTFFAAISPLISLGTLYQLIAQVGGMALLVLCVILFLNLFPEKRKLGYLRLGFLLAMSITALFIYYPEVAGILIASYFLFLISQLTFGWKITQRYIFILALTLFFSAIFLIGYFENLVGFIQAQTHNGLASFTKSIFPYYFTPLGFHYLFGVLGIAESKSSILLLGISGLFALGPFLVAIILGAQFAFKKKYGFAITLAAMFFLALFLFYKNSGFGLFKLAMYVQPFLIATLITAGFCFLKNHRKKIVALAIVLTAFNLHAQQYYVKRSLGTPGAFQELPYGSKNNISEISREIIQSIPKNIAIAYATPSLVLAKILAQYNNNHPSIFISDPFFKTYFVDDMTRFVASDSSIRNTIQHVRSLLNIQFNHAVFLIHSGGNIEIRDNAFQQYISFIKNHHPIIYIFPTATLDIINASRTAIFSKNPLVALEEMQAQNYLIFVNSALGQYYYYSKNPDLTGLYPLQADTFYANQLTQGFGNYLLFQILRPSEKVRLVINLTNTSLKNTKLPSIVVLDNGHQKLPVIGSGSARIVSKPLSPQVINGLYYLMLALNKPTLSNQHAPMTLVRNISVISETDYKTMHIPSELLHFPNDLSNSALFYSGIYEDGWFSPSGYCFLKKPPYKNTLVLRGVVPHTVTAFTTLTLSINGKNIYNHKLRAGRFVVKVSVENFSNTLKIGFNFSRELSPLGLKKSVGAKISSMEFE